MINLSTILVTFILVLSKNKKKQKQKTPNYIHQILRIKRKRNSFTLNITCTGFSDKTKLKVLQMSKRI